MTCLILYFSVMNFKEVLILIYFFEKLEAMS